jgi:hypothetical protein
MRRFPVPAQPQEVRLQRAEPVGQFFYPLLRSHGPENQPDCQDDWNSEDQDYYRHKVHKLPFSAQCELLAAIVHPTAPWCQAAIAARRMARSSLSSSADRIKPAFAGQLIENTCSNINGINPPNRFWCISGLLVK